MGDINAGLRHSVIQALIEHIDRVRAVARGHNMKIGLPFEAEFFPSAASIVAFDQAKRIDQVWRRMAAAIERVARCRETHEIMRRPICRGPAPLAVNGQSSMAWNEYLGAVRAVREAVDMYQLDLDHGLAGRVGWLQGTVRERHDGNGLCHDGQ